MRSHRKFRFLDFGIVGNFRTRKIVGFSVSKPATHFTLNMGGKSGVFDVHRTDEMSGVHETLYAMDSSVLPSLFQEIYTKIGPEKFLDIVRRLSIGWMHHNQIGFVTVSLPSELATQESDIEFDQESIRQRVSVPLWLDEIYDVTDHPVFLFKARRGRKPQWIGIAFKVPRPEKRDLLLWVKFRDLSKVVAKMTADC